MYYKQISACITSSSDNNWTYYKQFLRKKYGYEKNSETKIYGHYYYY